jgi:hypothetical protein
MTHISDLSLEDVLEIKRRLLVGDYQHDIAATYGLNQGRISEIKTGKRRDKPKASTVPQPLLF